MVRNSVLLAILIPLLGIGGNFVAPSGSGMGITTAQSQVGAGNNTFGNSSIYAANEYIANELFTNGETITHISGANISGGTYSTAPSFAACVEHGGGESCSSNFTPHNTQDTNPASDAVLALAKGWAAGDTVAIKIISLGSNCNSTLFDIDLLVQTP